MSRVIPVNYPTLDYTLWEELHNHASLISQEDIDKIAPRDGWSSRESKYWISEGRETSSGKVIDFIGLSSNFQNLDQIEFLSESIIDELKEKVNRLPGGREILSFDREEEWLQVNWPILAKVVGAAVASVGRTEDFWPEGPSGKDVAQSHRFWSEMNKSGTGSSKGRYLSYEEWENLVELFREKKLDPSSAVLRGQSHHPSCPVIVEGDRYYRNPIAIRKRERMREIYRGKGGDAKEFKKFHGSLTFEMIRKATSELSKGNIANFLFEIHGICAHHVMRESGLVQQKIGLHLVTNLAIRKITRGVGCIPVPDLAHVLETGFRLGAVLKILHDAGLIDWYTVDADRVSEAISEIKSR